MIKNKAVAFIVFIIVFFAVWNLCDFLFTTFINNSVFNFTVLGNAIVPTVVAVVVGFITVFRKK